MMKDLTPKRILISLLCVIFFLFLANLAGIISIFYFGHDYIFGLIPLVDFDHEKNIPTLYSSLALLVSAVLLSAIGYRNRAIGKKYFPWAGLAIVFLFLTIDEFFLIHEKFITPTSDALGISGLSYYAWIIPYTVGLGVLVLIYLKFLVNLPRRTAILFVISGGIFVLGAVGFELAGNLYCNAVGYNWGDAIWGENLIYHVMYTFEELLEMVGIALFIYALTSYMGQQDSDISVTNKRR